MRSGEQGKLAFTKDSSGGVGYGPWNPDTFSTILIEPLAACVALSKSLVFLNTSVLSFKIRELNPLSSEISSNSIPF